MGVTLGMIISHARKFIVFGDPLGAGDAVESILSPFGDVEICAHPHTSPFFHGMSPVEAEWAFDAAGFAFHSYLRIAITENPYLRLARLYDRIAQTDTVWQLRHLAGIGPPPFSSWLKSTRADGVGGGHRNSPRWRRQGAWSSKIWESGRIDHVIRTEAVEEDMQPILAALGIAPGMTDAKQDLLARDAWLLRYDEKSVELVSRRYAWDLAQYGYSAPRHSKAA